MRKNNKISLSETINPNCTVNHSLLMSRKGIQVIDNISSFLAKDVKVLDLSDNKIVELGTISQFINLETIYLCGNKIKDGRQLLKLCYISKLRNVFIQRNPFLKVPLNEDVLEFILQKNTDIQILSGTALKSMREIQQGQLKLIFLQNYLQKINYHQELASRFGNQHRSLTNQSIINKIIPQFYTCLENSNIKSNLKKQTVKMKRQNKYTIQQAIENKRKNQQIHVQNLIKDILALVEDQQIQITNEQKPQNININIRQDKNEKIKKQLNQLRIIKEPLTDKYKNQTQKNLHKIPQFTEFDTLYIQPQSLISPKSINNRQNTSIRFQNSFQNYQTLYYRNLTKINPIYQLLYSPLNSLNINQKNSLLESLVKNHKEISIELYRQKNNNLQIRSQNKNIKQKYQSQCNKLMNFVKESRQENSRKSQKCEQLQKDNKMSRQMLISVSNKIKYLQAYSKEKQTIIKAQEKDYHKIQQSCILLAKQIKKIENYQILEDIIQEKEQTRIKRQYYQIIKIKAIAWYQFQKKNRKRQSDKNQKLKIIGFTAFKKQKFINDYIRQKNYKIQLETQLNYFNHWKTYKQLNKKQKKIKIKMKHKIFQKFKKSAKIHLNISKNNKKNKKKANIFSNNKTYIKILKFLSNKVQQSDSKLEKSIKYWQSNLERKIIDKIKQIKSNNIKNQSIIKKIHQKFGKIHFFKRYVQIYQNKRTVKQQIENVQKIRRIMLFQEFIKINHNIQLQLKKYLQKYHTLLKKLGWKKFQEHSQIIIKKKLQIRNKLNQLKLLFKRRYYEIFIKIVKNNKNLIKNLKRKILKISKSVKVNTILRKTNQFYIEKNRNTTNAKNLIVNLRLNLKNNQQIKNKTILLSAFLLLRSKQKILRFINNTKIKKIKRLYKLKQMITVDKYLKRQRQWIDKLEIEDHRMRQLIDQINYRNNKITQTKQQQQLLQQQNKRMFLQLDYQQKIINAKEIELQAIKQETMTVEKKYSRLFQLYSATVENLKQKESDCIWLIERIEKDQNRGKNLQKESSEMQLYQIPSKDTHNKQTQKQWVSNSSNKSKFLQFASPQQKYYPIKQ